MAITHQMGTFIDMAVNDRLQCGSLFIVNGHGPHGATALNSDQYSLFGSAFATFMGRQPLISLRSAANVLFMGLYDTLKKPGIGPMRVHHLADRMAHAPGRWLRTSNDPGQF